MENLKAASSCRVEVGQRRAWAGLPHQDGKPHPAEGSEFRVTAVSSGGLVCGRYLDSDGTCSAPTSMVERLSTLVCGPQLSAPAATKEPEPAYQHTVKLLGRLAPPRPAFEEWQVRTVAQAFLDAFPNTTVAPKATNNTYTQCAHCLRIFAGTSHADAAEKLREHLVADHGAPAVAGPAAPKLCGMVCTNPVSHPDSPLCEKHIYQAMVARDEARRTQVPSSTETGLETSPKQSHVHPRGCLGVWNIRGGR